jgi:2-amino-4-hydroxy-6-hydroxymethyldihydropteridine diphosphokinase/dihydropteroate synthase
MLPDDAPVDWNRPFLNVVAHCRTDASPHDVLDALKAIERELGRVDRGRWAPRPIDLDLLLYGRETLVTDRLHVPHAGITERAFVLTPLAALEPRATLPGHGSRTVLEHARAGGHHLPLWMGIVNLTPDSFSDGGELHDDAAVETRVAELVAAGAQIVDLGAESTRPGATPLSADQEWARLEPALGRLVDRYRGSVLRPRFSIDTYHVETARRALTLGADIVNDVSGLTTEPMIERAAASGAEFVAMHNLGVPADKARTLTADQDPTAAVERWLEQRIAEWERAGVDLGRILFDPGIGFGKNALQSLRLLRNIERFHRFGLRLLVGHSRKSFMHGATAADRFDRDLFTIGASLNLCRAGVDILRVHNVAAHAAAYRGWAHVEPT